QAIAQSALVGHGPPSQIRVSSPTRLRGKQEMARTTSIQSTINSLTEAFARQLASVVEQAAAARIQSAILEGLGGGGRGPGRPRKDSIAALGVAYPSARKKAPKQLCP